MSDLWKHEESIVTSATPARIWALFADVPGWKKWNAGIEHIAIHGPFKEGTTFDMTPPGEEGFVSTLLNVKENQGFTDETVVNGNRVLVFHEIHALAPGQTRISYRTEITGPDAAEFGPMVVGDFPDVLAALKRTAEFT